MMSVPEAAKRAGRNPETIRRWIREGKLTSWKVGTQYLIDEDDLADAIRGVFADRETSDESEGPPRATAIEAGLQGSRADRAHQLNEVVAPYATAAMAGSTASATNDPWLPHVVGRIVRAVDPARIILFGSRARGVARADSDYDLLVVIDELPDRRGMRERIRRSFADLPVAADVLVAATAELEGRVPGRPAGAVYWAIHEGQRVYERDGVD
jgi:excisionase family DNA binding protein